MIIYSCGFSILFLFLPLEKVGFDTVGGEFFFSFFFFVSKIGVFNLAFNN